MTIRPILAAMFLLLAGNAAPAHWTVVDRIPGPDGRYDYVSVDPDGGRIFVGRGNGVMTVDPATRQVTPVFAGGEGVAAVLPIPGTPLLLATEGDANRAMLVDRRNGAVTARIATGRDPDGVTFDPASGFAFVMNGESEDITLIDVAAARVTGTIPAGGKPEAAVADGRGRLYVNIEDKAEILVIDIARAAVVGHYPLAGCVEPTGMGFDPATGLLIAACHNGVAKLIRAADGRDRGGFAIGRDADGVIFDGTRRLLYVPCNDGTLTIARLDRRGRARVIETVRTQVGARTAALDPASGRIYLPAHDYAPGPDGEPARVAGTFELLVVAPR